VKTIRYRTYVLVWAGLLVLTGMTVSLAGMNLGRLSILSPFVHRCIEIQFGAQLFHASKIRKRPAL